MGWLLNRRDNNLSIVGLTRMSLVTRQTLKSYKATKDLSFEEAQSLIYEPRRMRERITIFEAFCLPTYKMLHETDPRSLGLIFIGASMPAQLSSEIRSICAAVPGVRVVEVADDLHPSEAAREELEKAATGRVFSYRLDDDDALSSTFPAQVEAASREVEDGTVVSFDNGFSLARRGQDDYRLQERNYPMIALGLGVFASADQMETPLDLGNHARIAGTRKTHHVSTPHMWIRTMHADNDSDVRGLKREPARTRDDVAKTLSENFAHITPDALSALPKFAKAKSKALT